MDYLVRFNKWLINHPVIRKPLNTFWQSFLAVILVDLSGLYRSVAEHGLAGSKAALLAVVMAGVAAGFSAVKTYIIESLKGA